MKRVLSLAFAACLFLAGCGSSSQSPSENPSSNTFTVGMECNYAPFNWTQVEKTDTAVALGDGVSFADGYDVVIAKAIADKMGKELVIKKIAWEGLEPALSSGEIDAIIAGMTATEDRKQNANFTSPYYESEMVVIIRGDDAELADITNIQQLSGKKVLGQINTLYDQVIDQIEGVEHKTPLASYPLMVNALKSKDADALTAELPVATGVVSANPDLKIVQFLPGNGFQADTSVSIALKKGNVLLFQEVQDALDTIDANTRLKWMTDAVSRQPAAES